MDETKWFEATVTGDIVCDDKCPLCHDKSFHCADCEDGHAVRHMWGFEKREPFFKKNARVMVARRDSWIGDHDWNGVHQIIKFPEMYYVFEPSPCGKKLRVTTAYAIRHLRRVRPLRDMTKTGWEALSEWNYQMSR